MITSEGNFQGIYNCGEGNYEVSFEKITKDEFVSYIALLAGAGFEKYAENEISGNSFITYIKDTRNLFVSYFASLKELKIVIGAKKFLPETQKPVYTRIADTTLTQIRLQGAIDSAAVKGAPGMSYIMRLADGSFILIDGGPTNETDITALFDFLTENNKTGGKITIAAWFITHAHGDHMGLAINFINRYHASLDIKMVAYNFPDFATVKIPNEDPSGMLKGVQQFKAVIKNYFPKADTFVFHTGQKLYLADAEIEILFTHEDLYPRPMYWGNHTSSGFRITANGKTFMVLGDMEVSLCSQMAQTFGNYLKSDILQLTHHGFNGAAIELYQLIDPDICLWPVDEYRFLNDPRCLGTQSGYAFNAWIRDDTVKVRKHYTSSYTTTINF